MAEEDFDPSQDSTAMNYFRVAKHVGIKVSGCFLLPFEGGLPTRLPTRPAPAPAYLAPRSLACACRGSTLAA